MTIQMFINKLLDMGFKFGSLRQLLHCTADQMHTIMFSGPEYFTPKVRQHLWANEDAFLVELERMIKARRHMRELEAEKNADLYKN